MPLPYCVCGEQCGKLKIDNGKLKIENYGVCFTDESKKSASYQTTVSF